MTEAIVLNVFLHDKVVGTITRLPDDRNIFAFDPGYVSDTQRPVLSLSFKDSFGQLITEVKPTRTRLSPFFSNLLPEGVFREYLASQAEVDSQKEFLLLKVLGMDLPGAVRVELGESDGRRPKMQESEEESGSWDNDTVLRFSLAGIQLKLSAMGHPDRRLTVPVDGMGGSWIVKLPSPNYPGLPENEYVMLELARQVGIDVPETALVPLSRIQGIPRPLANFGTHAFVTRRFDRDERGRGIHIEDFAQVFGVFPEKKYSAGSYRNIAEVIAIEVGEKGVEEFIRRFVFNALIGNGDMHLKNWSLIYRDGRAAALSPAYDFVSTIPYLPNDDLALSFVDSRKMGSLDRRQFLRFAEKAKLPEKLVLDTVKETIGAFASAWMGIGDLPLDPRVRGVIEQHLKDLPLWRGV